MQTQTLHTGFTSTAFQHLPQLTLSRSSRGESEEYWIVLRGPHEMQRMSEERDGRQRADPLGSNFRSHHRFEDLSIILSTFSTLPWCVRTHARSDVFT